MKKLGTVAPADGPNTEPGPPLSGCPNRWLGSKSRSSPGRFRCRAFALWRLRSLASGVFGFVLGPSLGHHLYHRGQDQPYGTNRVVISGNRVIDQIGIAIGVDNGDDWNLQ